jgi:hypothetical protein
LLSDAPGSASRTPSASRSLGETVDVEVQQQLELRVAVGAGEVTGDAHQVREAVAWQ